MRRIPVLLFALVLAPLFAQESGSLGIFRGALDCRASEINEEMKLAAAHAIAAIISDAELQTDYIIPSVFNRRVAPAVGAAVEEAARRTGIARREGKPNREEEAKPIRV